MADPRTFTLIGEFKDGITPELEKINSSLTKLQGSLSNLGAKNTRRTSRDLGKLVTSLSEVSTALKNQAVDIKKAVTPMREYRSEVLKTARALRLLDRAGGRFSVIERENRALRAQAALMRQINNVSPRRGAMPQATAGGGGGGRAPRARGGGQSGFYGGEGNFHMAAFSFGLTLGQGLSQPLTTAIFSGFTAGVGLLQKSMNYIMNAFAERVKDEMTDLSAAGGYYSIAQRQKDPFVRTLQDAVDFTQNTNAVLAKLANALPGDTQDYVEVSKRVGDSIARLVTQNEKGAMEYAKQLRAQGDNAQYYGAIQGTPAEMRKQTMQVLIGEITKKTVLAGFGGSSGAGGQRGPHGLPALMERMLTDQNISEGKLNRYAAIFGDPKISAAIGRYMPKLQAAGGDMLKRFKILNEMYDEIVPPEMVAAMRNSMAGLTEAFRGAFLNPEVGFLGIGRKLKDFAPKMNLYGQFLNEAGQVVDSAAKAAKTNISVFEMFRDILANFGAALIPIVDNLSALWDPMMGIGEALQKARNFSSKFLTWFRNYNKGLVDYANTLKDEKAKDAILSTRNLRASLATINNLFANLGVISNADFAKTGKMLMDPKVGMKGLSKIMSGMFQKFFTSDAAKKLGEFIGTLLGTILKQISTITGFFAKRLGGGKLMDGFATAFQASGGFAALENIFKDIYTLIFKAMAAILPRLPWQVYAVAIAGVALPALINFFTMLFAEVLTGKLLKMLAGKAAPGIASGVGAMTAGGGRRGRFGGFFSARGMEARGRLARRTVKGYSQFGMEAAGLGYNMMGRPGARAAGGMAKGMRGLGKVGRFVPGGAIAGAALDLGVGMASGESFGQAAASAMGTALGGVVGSVFGPVGTMIGMTAGSFIGNWVGQKLADGSNAQRAAAAAQMKAAQVQQQANAIAQAKYLKEGQYLGGIEAINQQLGGGAGLKALLADKTKMAAMGLRPEEVQQVQILAGYMSQLNVATAKTQAAQNAYQSAVNNNTKNQQQALATLKAAQAQQVALETKMKRTWETTTLGAQQKLLTAAGSLAAAINTAASKLKGSGGSLPGAGPSYEGNLKGGTAVPRTPGGLAAAVYAGSPGKRMSLGQAIATENKHKPAGSHLVIANSSETVIPAAGGFSPLGGLASSLMRFIPSLQGLSTMADQMMAPGGPLGAATGSLGAAAALARSFGLTMTSYKRSGPPGASYHNVGRAMDFSNGTAPTPQMMAFAQAMAGRFGSRMSELIYTPLGYGIKNGQRVPPYAASSHYNHVHVAFGTGYGMPFTSAMAAMRYEKAMAPSGAKIASITANSSEGIGGTTTMNNHITITQQPGQDSEELAAVVLQYLGNWVSDARASSIFV